MLASIAVAVYLVLPYLPYLGISLVNDDYIFIDRFRGMRFQELWGFQNTSFGWYRPISRELHFWIFSRLGLASPATLRLANEGLWLLAAAGMWVLVRLISTSRAAWITVLGMGSLSLAAVPVHWASGSQDLYLLVLAPLIVLAVLRGYEVGAAALLTVGLLCKESAVVLVVIAGLALMCIQRVSFSQMLRRLWPLLLVTGAWLLVHPTLGARLHGGVRESAETAGRPGLMRTLALGAMSFVNLDAAPVPDGGWLALLPATGVRIAIAVGVLLWAFRDQAGPARGHVDDGLRRSALFSSAWCGVALLVTLAPSIGWHAYYGLLAAVGAWITIALFLSQHRRISLVVITAMLMIQSGRLATPSNDWGTLWYHVRAGTLLGEIRSRLLQLHPTLPAHARLHFARIPTHIGMLAADGPAIRQWYEAPDVEGRFYSAYARSPRAEGPEFFFVFDSLVVLREVVPGQPRGARKTSEARDWRHDHEVLASLFMDAGQVLRAATEYAVIADADPRAPEFATYAAGAYLGAGQARRAAAYRDLAARILGAAASDSAIAVLARAAAQRAHAGP